MNGFFSKKTRYSIACSVALKNINTLFTCRCGSHAARLPGIQPILSGFAAGSRRFKA